MYKVLAKQQLASQIKLVRIHAPDIAAKAKPGQFVIVRVDDKGERIPLTLVNWEKERGEITLIFQEVGVTTRKLGMLEVEDGILDIIGPLGNPSETTHHSVAAVVCGGVGMATAFPIAKALKEAGDKVVSIVGAKSKDLLILNEEIKNVSDELHVATDDGSKGFKGLVSDLLKVLIEQGYRFDVVYSIGPPLMMKATSDVTRSYGIKTIVSLNPIMVDGMGMCGACRVTVAGKTKFACIDGPEFDGHQVDFDELVKRLRMYQTDEKVGHISLRSMEASLCQMLSLRSLYNIARL